MSTKFCKILMLTLIILFIPTSLGACKTHKSLTAGKDTATYKSTAHTSTTSKISVSGNNNTTANASTASQDPDNAQTQPDSDVSVYKYGSTTSEEMKKFLNSEPMDIVPITYINHNLDLGGRTIRIVYDTDINKSPGEPPSNLELAQNPNSIIRYTIMENASIRMNFNIDWVYKSHDSAVYEYMDAAAAGVKYADILLSSTKRVFPQLVTKKLLVPIDNFIDFNNDPLYNAGTMSSGTEFLGRKWGFCKDPYNIGYVFFYNRDIFAKEGLTDLQQVYKQGNWTWETMVSYAKAATHDFNGDGRIDQWGILLSHPHRAAQALILSNGGDMIKYDSEQNTYKFAANDDKAARALQLMTDMISANITTSDSSVKFDGFPSAMVIGKVITDGLAYKQVGMNYGIVPLPKGPDVSETQFVDGSGTDAYFIPLNTDPKASAAVILEAFTYWNNTKPDYMTKEDIMDSKLQTYLCTSEDAKWTIQNFNSPRVSHILSFNNLYTNFNRDVVERSIFREITAATALDIFKESLQNDITSALNQ